MTVSLAAVTLFHGNHERSRCFLKEHGYIKNVLSTRTCCPKAISTGGSGFVKDRPRNLEASVKNSLLQIARKRGEELQSVLTPYAIERFLYRLSCSDYRRQFIVKGASLFVFWMGAAHRPTRDLDLMGFGSDEPETVVEIFQVICRHSAEEDGLIFEADTVRAAAV